MARLILSDSLEAIQKNVQDWSAKHTADGVSSPLIALLTENAIVPGNEVTAIAAAITKDADFGKAQRKSEKESKQRDLLIGTIWKNMTGGMQSLKKIYVANPNTVGDWGATVDNDNRIVYPTDFNERITLINTFWAKHNSFPVGTSPLQAFVNVNTIVPVDELTAAADALNAHNSFRDNANDAETLSAERDDLLNPVIDHLLLIGQFLVGLFVANPKKAGDWGFTVDDSPRKDVVRTGTVPAGEQKVLRNIAAGTSFKNTGTQAFQLMRGTVAGGTIKTIKPGASIPVTFGFGTSTLINTSDTIPAGYEGTFNV